jgi:hypothetical protein
MRALSYCMSVTDFFWRDVTLKIAQIQNVADDGALRL